MGQWETILWYSYLAAAAGVLLRMLQYRIASTYRYLAWYLLAQVGVGLALLPFSVNSNLYAVIYLGGETLYILLSIAAVLEIYRLTLADRPALAAFGRRAVIYLLAASGLIAAAGFWLDAAVRPGQSLILHRFWSVERTVELMLVVALLAASAFLLWFPVRVRRNIVVYVVGFVLHFVASSSVLLLTNLLPQAVLRTLGTAMMALELVSTLIWLVGLRAESRDTSAVTGHRWNPDALEALTAQLDAINAALSRHVRD